MVKKTYTNNAKKNRTTNHKVDLNTYFTSYTNNVEESYRSELIASFLLKEKGNWLIIIWQYEQKQVFLHKLHLYPKNKRYEKKTIFIEFA